MSTNLGAVQKNQNEELLNGIQAGSTKTVSFAGKRGTDPLKRRRMIREGVRAPAPHWG
jgi:hypothetical protein